MKTPAQSFWVTNTSNRNVSLADLNLTIRALTSVNLLDSRHYQYTLEQLQKSVDSGSLAAKRDKIVVRKNAPIVEKKTLPFDRETFMPSRERSVFSIKEEYYEELTITDDQYAIENVDLAEPESPKSTKKE